MMNKVTTLVALFLTSAVAGCAVDGTSEDQAPEKIGNTLEAISNGTGSWFGDQSNNHNYGATNAQTCFLSGIHGEFGGVGGYIGSFGHQLPVFTSTGLVPLTSPTGSACTPGTTGCFWIAQNVNAGQSPGLGLDVSCIYGSPTNLCYASATSYNQGGNSPGHCPANPNGHTRCFLTSVATAGQLRSSSNFAVITPPSSTYFSSGGSGDFTIQTNMNADGGPNDLDGYAYMVCIDIPTIQGWWTFGITGPSNGGNTASATTLLRNFYPGGPQVPVANVSCGLTGIAGNWMNAPDPLGWNDGVIANSPAGGFWSYTVTNGRTGDIACVE